MSSRPPTFRTKFVAALATFAVLAVVVAALRAGDHEPPVRYAIGPIDEFPFDVPVEVTIGVGHYDPYQPEGPGQSAPGVVEETLIFVVNRAGASPVALDRRSPWLGCRVQVATREEGAAFGHALPDGFEVGFADPCHGGVYAIDGTHVAGPGSRSLSRYPVYVDGSGTVMVDLTSLVAG